MAKGVVPLQQIRPDIIKKNPNNPRLIFREQDMIQLMESIAEVGIKVPVSVYPDGNRFVLIDGERRWRCAKKLNLGEVPAIVQPKPSPLENLLMMFNIHHVRVDWELMPTALKLGEIREMLAKDGKSTSPKALSAITGVRLPTVRRALDLLELPRKYQRALLREAQKPRNEQRFTADLFVEVYKSLHAVERHVPEVFDKVSKPDYVDSMVKKYTAGVVDNVVGYRDVSKIARAERAGVAKQEAIPALVRLVEDKDYSIDQAFQDTVQAAYEKRDLLANIRAVIARLVSYGDGTHFDIDTREALEELRTEITRLLGQ